VPHQPTPDGYRGGDGVSPPLSAERSIFRAQALQRYRENQEKVVLPRLVSPRIFVYLWVLAIVLLLAGSIIAFWPLIEQLL
jgi:hypothetical protein